LIKQTTLRHSVETSGVGLHTAVPVHIKLVPAPPNTGYIFVRTDLNDFEISASVEWIAHCSYATTLMRTGVMLSTVEHLLAALRGAGVDNVFIEIDNLELPIMDGSAAAFSALIEGAGLIEQDAVRRALQIRERVEVVEGDRRMTIEPLDRFESDCTIEFPHPLIGAQNFLFEVRDDSFARLISKARTFGFTAEIDALRKANLVQGGSLENAIVLTPEGMLNESPLRFSDEFARHKILDIIGDLALLGMPLLGRVTAIKSGHVIHAALMTKLLRQRSAWEVIDLSSDQKHQWPSVTQHTLSSEPLAVTVI